MRNFHFFFPHRKNRRVGLSAKNRVVPTSEMEQVRIFLLPPAEHDTRGVSFAYRDLGRFHLDVARMMSAEARIGGPKKDGQPTAN